MSDKRLLVVDDEPEIGELVREVAGEMGYDVTITRTAEEFREAYKATDPTLIMMDIVMPDCDGLELLRELADQNCRARVLIMSGYSEKYLESAERLSDAYGLRSIERLTKPIRLGRLREVLADQDPRPDGEPPAPRRKDTGGR